MFSKPKFGDQSPTKEEVKQLNDELDLQHYQDNGISERFAEKLKEFESNPDLSFLRDQIGDATLIEKGKGVNKMVTFRCTSPEQFFQPTPLLNMRDVDSDETEDSENIMEKNILFEIKRNSTIFMNFAKRQGDLQEELVNAYAQKDHDGEDNPKIASLTTEINNLIGPIQSLSVTLGGLNISLKLVRENDIRKMLEAEPDIDINNNNNNLRKNK